jgi:superfamily II DNA helicase RecQ
VAFGMGINIPDVDIVIHWGLPTSCLSFWQEIGRCARDDREGHAVCYGFKRSVSKCDDEMKSLMKLESCVRASVLQNFHLRGMSRSHLERIKEKPICNNECDVKCVCRSCRCCSVCSSLCTCPQRSRDHLDSFLS